MAEPKEDPTTRTQQIPEVQAVMEVLRKQQADQVAVHPPPGTGDMKCSVTVTSAVSLHCTPQQFVH